MSQLFLKAFFIPFLFLSSAVFAAEDEPLNKEQAALHYAVGPTSSDLKGSVFNRDRRYADNFAVALRSAVRSEDTKLYSEKMRYLLEKVSIESFLEILFSKDNQGNNIFHLMAGVQDPKARAFFAQDMQTLIDLFTGRLIGTVLLGGVEIVIPAQDNLWAEAATQSGQDPGGILLKGQKKLDSLKKQPAIEFIKAIYARDSEGQTFIERFSAHLSFLPVFSPSEEFVEKWMRMAESLSRKLDSSLFHAENNRGNKPIDIAYRVENPHAYRVLRQSASVRDKSSNFFGLGFLVGIFGLIASPAVALAPWAPDYALLTVVAYYGALLSAPFLSSACYRAVTKQKKKRLEGED